MQKSSVNISSIIFNKYTLFEVTSSHFLPIFSFQVFCLLSLLLPSWPGASHGFFSAGARDAL